MFSSVSGSFIFFLGCAATFIALSTFHTYLNLAVCIRADMRSAAKVHLSSSWVCGQSTINRNICMCVCVSMCVLTLETVQRTHTHQQGNESYGLRVELKATRLLLYKLANDIVGFRGQGKCLVFFLYRHCCFLHGLFHNVCCANWIWGRRELAAIWAVLPTLCKVSVGDTFVFSSKVCIIISVV